MATQNRKKLGVFARFKHNEENLDELQRLVRRLRDSDRQLHLTVSRLNNRIGATELMLAFVFILLSALALVHTIWWHYSGNISQPQPLAV